MATEKKKKVNRKPQPKLASASEQRTPAQANFNKKMRSKKNDLIFLVLEQPTNATTSLERKHGLLLEAWLMN